jgi:hypothetical protein
MGSRGRLVHPNQPTLFLLSPSDFAVRLSNAKLECLLSAPVLVPRCLE